MPSVYDLKPAFQAMLRPAVKKLAAKGVTPNQVTLVALGISWLIGGVVAFAPDSPRVLLLVPGWMFLRMAMNAIDGMLAREHDMRTPLGGMLNELTDVLADAGLMLPFALIEGVPGALVVIFVVLAAVTELAGVVAQTLGASRRYDGPMGKSDRAAVFGILALVLGFGVQTGPWTLWLFVALVALVAGTVVNRCRRALQELDA